MLVMACGDDDPAGLEPAAAVFEVRVADQENFRFSVTSAARIAEAEAILAAGGETIVAGDLARGDGGHNAPYSWHLVDETIHFPDQAIEACSGRPMSDVQADLDYWVDTLGQYCPWGSRIVQRIQ
jgi:hypothetical protein